MDLLLEFDRDVVLWLNRLIGQHGVLDQALYLLVSDYFIPLVMCFWVLGLWFQGKDYRARGDNQRGVLGAAIALGFANLAVLIINQHVFKDRPIAQHELANLLYSPTDSSFPSNPSAIAFAFATGVWLRNRRASVVVFLLAALWSAVRVANGLFYPSDVLAGALIGVAVAVMVWGVLRAIEPVPSWVLRGAGYLHLA